MKAADGGYFKIWRWRAKYGGVLGAMGTGAGDGDRGVVCGREHECCMARQYEQEIDAAAEDGREAALSSHLSTLLPLGNGPPLQSASSSSSSQESMDGGSISNAHSRTPRSSSSLSSHTTAPGYERHEVQGIGGVMKKTMTRIVRVGACVPEWDDEQLRPGTLLGREVAGSLRSWCGWCGRVIPGEKDREATGTGS